MLPVLSNGLPPDDGKPRHSIGLDNSKDWLSKTLGELRDLAAQFHAPAPAPRVKAPASSRHESFVSKPAVGLAATLFFGVIAIVLVFWH